MDNANELVIQHLEVSSVPEFLMHEVRKVLCLAPPELAIGSALVQFVDKDKELRGTNVESETIEDYSAWPITAKASERRGSKSSASDRGDGRCHASRERRKRFSYVGLHELVDAKEQRMPSRCGALGMSRLNPNLQRSNSVEVGGLGDAELRRGTFSAFMAGVQQGSRSIALICTPGHGLLSCFRRRSRLEVHEGPGTVGSGCSSAPVGSLARGKQSGLPKAAADPAVATAPLSMSLQGRSWNEPGRILSIPLTTTQVFEADDATWTAIAEPENRPVQVIEEVVVPATSRSPADTARTCQIQESQVAAMQLEMTPEPEEEETPLDEPDLHLSSAPSDQELTRLVHALSDDCDEEVLKVIAEEASTSGTKETVDVDAWKKQWERQWELSVDSGMGHDDDAVRRYDSGPCLSQGYAVGLSWVFVGHMQSSMRMISPTPNGAASVPTRNMKRRLNARQNTSPLE